VARLEKIATKTKAMTKPITTIMFANP